MRDLWPTAAIFVKTLEPLTGSLTTTKSFALSNEKENVEPVISDDVTKCEKVYDLWGDVLSDKNKTRWFKTHRRTQIQVKFLRRYQLKTMQSRMVEMKLITFALRRISLQ
jgi:hypothetical protein